MASVMTSRLRVNIVFSYVCPIPRAFAFLVSPDGFTFYTTLLLRRQALWKLDPQLFVDVRGTTATSSWWLVRAVLVCHGIRSKAECSWQTLFGSQDVIPGPSALWRTESADHNSPLEEGLDITSWLKRVIVTIRRSEQKEVRAITRGLICRSIMV